MGFGLGSQYAKDIALKGIRGVTNNYITSDYPILSLGKEKFSEGLGGAFEQFISGKIQSPLPLMLIGLVLLLITLLVTIGDDTS